ncbi:hypothetical protein [Croceivirga radicis]|uniref:STAS/SEC14 domain-containing protein n=1 Tax=Croceivirga radicis TaxID=1929488 RepID=A0A1V6LVZ6_9FLAO|nr:hypothetical protein [Croceivirga radicis]OQD44186.1 hypothetical protein BUL40_01120 [Croceivirga radicis]
MERVTDIAFFNNIREIREYNFGKFYFFDKLVISEIKEGVTFNWVMAERVIEAAYEVYDVDKLPVVYLSNRINRYQIVPKDWLKFYKNRHSLKCYGVVAKNKSTYANVVLERMFFKNAIRQFTNLEDAIAWAQERILEENNTTI